MKRIIALLIVFSVICFSFAFAESDDGSIWERLFGSDFVNSYSNNVTMVGEADARLIELALANAGKAADLFSDESFLSEMYGSMVSRDILQRTSGEWRYNLSPARVIFLTVPDEWVDANGEKIIEFAESELSDGIPSAFRMLLSNYSGYVAQMVLSTVPSFLSNTLGVDWSLTTSIMRFSSLQLLEGYEAGTTLVLLDNGNSNSIALANIRIEADGASSAQVCFVGKAALPEQLTREKIDLEETLYEILGEEGRRLSEGLYFKVYNY